MCAMKEVTLFLDDAKSRESAKQLGQVNWLAILVISYLMLHARQICHFPRGLGMLFLIV